MEIRVGNSFSNVQAKPSLRRSHSMPAKLVSEDAPAGSSALSLVYIGEDVSILSDLCERLKTLGAAARERQAHCVVEGGTILRASRH